MPDVLVDFPRNSENVRNYSVTLPLNRSHNFILIVDLVVSRREGYPPTFLSFIPYHTTYIHLIKVILWTQSN